MNISFEYSVENLPNIHLANVFFQKEFADLQRASGRECVYLLSGSFVVPLIMMKKVFFKYASFPSEPFNFDGSGNESVEGFISSVCIYAREQFKVQWIAMNSPASLFAYAPPFSKKIPFGSHVINLSLTEDELWNNIHSKHRNVIRKAESIGVQVECGRSEKCISDFHLIDVETWRRSGKNAFSLNSISRIVKVLGDKAIIYIAYYNGKPQSGALYYVNHAMCYYMFGANCDSPVLGSGNLLQWRAIMDMKSSGVEKFSFVGCRINADKNSKYYGIQRFKERFGGELVQGYLFKIDFIPIMRKFFNILVAFKSFFINHKFVLPKDVIDQEISKWN